MPMMKMEFVRNLAKKVKELRAGLRKSQYKCSITGESVTTPTGFVAVYVGEERRRFVVPVGYLSHPLFKMLLEKAYEEYGFEQNSGLEVPCTVSAFQEVISAIECSHGQFDIEKLVKEFL